VGCDNLLVLSRDFHTVKMACFGNESKTIVCHVVLLDESEIAIEIKVGPTNNCVFVYNRVPSRLVLHLINKDSYKPMVNCGFMYDKITALHSDKKQW
jgi:hypothetical protein